MSRKLVVSAAERDYGLLEGNGSRPVQLMGDESRAGRWRHAAAKKLRRCTAGKRLASAMWPKVPAHHTRAHHRPTTASENTKCGVARCALAGFASALRAPATSCERWRRAGASSHIMACNNTLQVHVAKAVQRRGQGHMLCEAKVAI